MESSLQRFMDGVVNFALASDVPTVILLVFLTFLIRRTLWAQLHMPAESIVWVSIALSFVLTPIMSTAAEAQWGGQFYIRAVLYNGTVSVALWLMVVPRLLKKWPQLLAKDPMEVPCEEKEQSPAVVGKAKE